MSDPIAMFPAYSREEVGLYGLALDTRIAAWRFSQYLRSQRKYLEEENRDDIYAIEDTFWSMFGDLLEE